MEITLSLNEIKNCHVSQWLKNIGRAISWIYSQLKAVTLFVVEALFFPCPIEEKLREQKDLVRRHLGHI